MAFRGTAYLEKAKDYETEQLKAYILEILADESDHRVDSVELSDPPGVHTHTQKIKRLREILTEEVKLLTREQRLGLLDAADRRGAVFSDN